MSQLIVVDVVNVVLFYVCRWNGLVCRLVGIVYQSLKSVLLCCCCRGMVRYVLYRLAK